MERANAQCNEREASIMARWIALSLRSLATEPNNICFETFLFLRLVLAELCEGSRAAFRTHTHTHALLAHMHRTSARTQRAQINDDDERLAMYLNNSNRE